jgi:hypothetical protein
MMPKPRCALLKKPSQQIIIIASQSKKSLYCEVPFTSIACSLDVLQPLVETLWPKELPVTKICHWICMKQNMHAYMERMYNYYNYSRTCALSAEFKFHQKKELQTKILKEKWFWRFWVIQDPIYIYIYIYNIDILSNSFTWFFVV